MSGLYLIRAKFRSKCARCRRMIAVGELVLYDPATKSVRCDRC